MDVLGVFLETLHLHFHGIRNFLVVIKKDFLTDYLADKESRRLVGQLLLVEVRRTVGQKLSYSLQQHVHTKLVLG